tara:strand:+ start:442 stop:546 length:105 start_codon:yes stop_codon:yes gene_type:complete
MKLGVICDGISRNLGHAVDVMDYILPTFKNYWMF